MTANRFMPKLIEQSKTVQLRLGTYCDLSVHNEYAIPLMQKGWRLYVTSQSRGYCYGLNQRVITIPAWAIARGKEYSTWYIAHELAHAYAKENRECDNHGPKFMAWLIKICPAYAIHNEASYKPRNLVAAGAKFDADTCGF